MDNDELLLMIKGLFNEKTKELTQLFDEKTKEFKDEVNGVKNYMNVIAEHLRKDIRAVAEGHSILDRKLNVVIDEVTGMKSELGEVKAEVAGMKSEIKGMTSELSIVKEFVIRVDSKLNEHDKILKVIG